MSVSPPLLLPVPARVEVRGGGGVDVGAGVHELRRFAAELTHGGGELPRVRVVITGGSCGATAVSQQAYRLQVGADGAVVEAAAVAGARHGLATLRQLVAQYGAAVPRCEIEDHPSFAVRGLMLDVSRDRVPTMVQLFEVVDLLADLKMNHLQLYTEHTFAYEGHEAVWSGWSPMTPDEVRRLDTYARARGVELAANQNCFGHLRSWLEHPHYRHLAETHGDWMFDVWPRSGPFSLCPTDPASLAFVEGLLDQLMPCFTSPRINIGCDETYDIAYGRSKEAVAERGRAAVYMEFVRAVAGAVKARGGVPMFWADIALSHPECIAEIPEEMIALAWGYEADAPFAKWCEALGAAGRRAWVCPGTSSWRSITGRTTESRANIESAAKCALTHGAEGFLLCDWGDTGHWQQWPIVQMAIAHGAGASWRAERPEFDAAAASFVLFGDRSSFIAEWLTVLGDIDLPLRETCGALSRPDLVRLRNQSAIFIDMFKNWSEQREVGEIEQWRGVTEHCAALRSVLDGIPLSPLLRAELVHTLNLAEFAAARAVARRDGASQREFAATARERIAG
ncbi:MAG: beta-N-acetylhexosaminidase, partial [Phycisphaerales bacterium]